MKTTIVVRYFAGIAEAAGVAEDRLDAESTMTLGDVVRELTDRHGQEFGQHLRMCAMLVDGRRFADDDVVSHRENVEIDILPPFAGG
ncbi:MoaD/ThiS family protein [Arcanobacterium buesumense]|uniref:MoaD/ThiS family protein n=1 Tax=Arcanobacterium buesumense TaxID=2722751 RepID=A0A6H2EM86_9ACTO|nr:MoaD/ThiS family protein [Arcanobacterium buesumense]QJC22184.1 MoaD/ThiS family protein [Arcanobacterium buesumense]